MKSYEEMTEMVLQRARVQKAAQKRRRSKALIATACACCISLMVFAAARTNQPADGEENRTPRLSLFCVTANAAAQRQPMLKGERVPYHAAIHVRDIRGLDAWELLEQTWNMSSICQGRIRIACPAVPIGAHRASSQMKR